jgi:hypothetical protein
MASHGNVNEFRTLVDARGYAWTSLYGLPVRHVARFGSQYQRVIETRKLLSLFRSLDVICWSAHSEPEQQACSREWRPSRTRDPERAGERRGHNMPNDVVYMLGTFPSAGP